MYGSSPRLRVRAVPTKRDTFVALPPLLADQCRQVASAGPLPIELVEISPPCKRHVLAFVGQQVSDKPQRAGPGETSGRDNSHADCVEVSATYAEYLGLRDGAIVRAHVRTDVPQATKVTLSPATEADYAALSISSQAAEQGDVLNQVAVVTVGARFPLWVDTNKHLVTFCVREVLCSGASSNCGLLGLGTELVILSPSDLGAGGKANAEKKKEAGMEEVAGASSRSGASPGAEEAAGASAMAASAEIRVISLTRALVPELQVEDALVPVSPSSPSHCVWNVSKGFVAPSTLRRFLRGRAEEAGDLSSRPFVCAKVIPKVLEGSEESIGGPRGSGGAGAGGAGSREGGPRTSVCVELVPSGGVPEGHVALAPSTVLSMGVERLQRVVLVPLVPAAGGEKGAKASNSATKPAREAISFSLEVSEWVDPDDGEDEDEDGGDGDGGGGDGEGAPAPAKLVADAATCEAVVNALVRVLGEDSKEPEPREEKQGGGGEISRDAFLTLSRGMILEAFDWKTAKTAKFLIRKVTAASSEDQLPGLGSLEHVCIPSQAAQKNAVEFEIALGDPIVVQGGAGGEPDSVEAYGRKKAFWECPWLLSARTRCLDILRVAVDRSVYPHFVRSGIKFPGGLLVHGASGSGKTVLCQSLCDYFSQATHLCKVVWLDCQELATMDLEKMKHRMRSAVSKAVECQPSLLVCENVDIFNSSQGDGQASLETFQCEIFSEYFSHLMDCVRGDPHCVSFLATARDLEAVHKSLKKSGCFDTHFAMPVPTRREKADIFKKLSDAKRLHVDEATLEHVVRNCDGLDVLDMDALVELTLHRSLSNLIQPYPDPTPTRRTKGDGEGKEGARLQVSLDDMRAILKDYVPSKARGTSHVADDSKISSWSDIEGMSEATAELEDLLSFSSKYKDLIQNCPLRLRTGALLYGPPGCGKTFLVRSAAKICNLRIITVKGPELLNKYIGASEAGVRELFERASGASPCILFFDEFDAIAPKRGHDSTGVTDRVVNQFLAELDGIESLVGVFVLAATSRPDMIDNALLRPGRLDRMVYCPFPGEADRCDILRRAFRALHLADDVDDALVRRLAADTSHYSGADLVALLSDAQLLSAKAHLNVSMDRDADEGRGGAEDGDGGRSHKPPPVSRANLEEALRQSRPSLGISERVKLDAVYSRFHEGRSAPGAGGGGGGAMSGGSEGSNAAGADAMADAMASFALGDDQHHLPLQKYQNRKRVSHA